MSTTDLPLRHRSMRADAHRNRERLLAAAQAAFVEHGIDASLEDVARRAEVGIGTLYRHFPTREALLEAVLRKRVEALRDQARELLAAPDAAEALEAWLRSLATTAGVYRGVPASLIKAMKDPGSELGALCAEMLATSGELLARAQRAGSVRPDADMAEVGAMLSAIAMVADGAPDPAGVTDHLVTILMDGLRTRPSGGS
jgi:AcrR family transcriptional regulator